MKPSADYMVSCGEGGGFVRIDDSRALPIKGTGNLSMSVWSGKDWMQVIL